MEPESSRNGTPAGSGSGDAVATPISATSVAENCDYVSSLDWGTANVVHSAKCVMEELMTKTFSNVGHKTEPSRSHDPRISMEMRHKQVHSLVMY